MLTVLDPNHASTVIARLSAATTCRSAPRSTASSQTCHCSACRLWLLVRCTAYSSLLLITRSVSTACYTALVVHKYFASLPRHGGRRERVHAAVPDVQPAVPSAAGEHTLFEETPPTSKTRRGPPRFGQNGERRQARLPRRQRTPQAAPSSGPTNPLLGPRRACTFDIATSLEAQHEFRVVIVLLHRQVPVGRCAGNTAVTAALCILPPGYVGGL